MLLWRDDTLATALQRTSDDTGWPEYLRGLTKGPVPRHLAFAVSVCGCANGCSRPHIAGLGLIPARSPKWDAAGCDRCLACIGACREHALSMDKATLAIDRDKCLRCGDCLKACKSGALATEIQGYRLLIGGRLGRKPRFGRELPGLFSPHAVPDVLRLSLELMMSRTDPFVRFAETIDMAGPDFWAELESLAP
jgi:dissimilatory sulfite reductase (desulfoviridin) alpha/beta subunit